MPLSLFSAGFLAQALALFTALPYASAGPSDDVWSRLLNPCPRDCSETSSPAEWAVYNSLDRLSTCNQTTRVAFSLYNPSSGIRACSTSAGVLPVKAAIADTSSKNFAAEEVTLEIGWWDTQTSSSPAGVRSAVENVRKALLTSENTASTTAFSYSGNSLVGLYAGQGILHSDAATTALQHFTQYLETQDTIGRVLLQYCGVNSNKGLGIVVDTTGDFAAVQRIMRDWNEAKCQKEFDSSKTVSKADLRMKMPTYRGNSTTATSSHVARRHGHSSHAKHSHHRRATCNTIQVAGGDTCESLAEECGITPAKFTEYNSDTKLCSSLQSGQHVCCSAGDLPDFTPKPEPDGTCASILVQDGDFCSAIASANSVTIQDLEDFNKNTWGWMGCDLLQPQQKICLSKGDPPMPAIVDDAVCGPQVPGTERPSDGTALADLNPCPLKTCCDIWGQCGITDEFCTITKSPTGAPGTAKNGTNGCISHCGTDIIKDDSPPDKFITIGYFEAWNFERDCLHMDVTDFDTSAYSHLHFAFAEISNDYNVDISMVQEQFDKLKNLGSVHRVLSFGGWSFSTEADSFPIFREGVTDANRELFATNVANFIVDHDLEGVDFDWEYPGAPDIPGIPPGDKGDGDRYLEFLKLVRDKLPSEKTLAIAAPASFWYLKGFPIAKISEVVDYIVYMSYDLHGQWDYDNQYAILGCPEGNCLRSHVNLTETTSALSMITKAGVPSSKVIVGLSSYGRSFKMTKEGCTGPMCRYEGPESGAQPGRCTKTAGYISDAEINEILDEDNTAKTSYDQSSDSNILVYNSTQWVAYMDDDTRFSRTDYYESLNMGGTTDWAVDLQSFAYSSGGGAGGSGSGSGSGSFNQSIAIIGSSIWEGDSHAAKCRAPCVLVLPDIPLSSTSVFTRPPYVTTLDVAWPTPTTVTSNGVVVTTTTVTRILQETTLQAPPVTVSSIPIANINVTIPLGKDDNITLTPKARFPAQTFTITNDPNPLKQTGVTHPPVTRRVTLPPWPQATVIYYGDDGQDSNDNNDDDNNDDDNDDGDDNDDNDDDNNGGGGGGDNDIHLPKIPKITLSEGPEEPKCPPDEDCDGPCVLFCHCFICPGGGGGGGGDGGFADPSDPNPPARPAGDPTNNSKDPDNSCSETSTATDYWVSCESKGSTSTSCTTTSSMLHVGCDVSASTTTTGENVCHLIDWDEDQGDDSKNRPSDNPGPKPTSTTSTTSKTTSTSTATSTTTTGKPVPPGLPSSRDDIQFVIFAANRITDDDSTWRWAGYLLPRPGYDDEDVCNEKYEVLSDPDVKDDQAWPISMGPFNAPDLDYCSFHKLGDPPNNPGYVSCSNHHDMLMCIGLDGKHAVRNPAHTCTGSGGEKTEFWLQAWCPLKG